MNVAGVKPAERVLMVGAGNIGLIVSYQLMQAGVEVASIIEAAPKIGGYLVHASKIRRSGVPIRTGYTIEKAYGTDALEGVVIVQVDSPVPACPRHQKRRFLRYALSGSRTGSADRALLAGWL